MNTDDAQPVDEAGGATTPKPHGPRHLAPDDAGERPLIDLSRDPTPGVPDHAAPDDED